MRSNKLIWTGRAPVYIQTLLPILAWGGLYLREPRLWELMPLRKPELKTLSEK